MAAPNTSELTVTGMTCNNCARHVTEAIQSVAGVRSATVSLAGGSATVRWHPDGTQNIPALLSAIAQAGYAAREISVKEDVHARPNHWQRKLMLGLGVTVFLMAGEWGFGLAMTSWFQWLAFVLAGMVQIICGAPFYRGAWNQLKVGSSNMDTLVALGSTTAFGYSTWALFSGTGGHLYFMEAAAIISLISAGHWLEARVSEQAGGALKALLELAPPTARKIPQPDTANDSAGRPLNLRNLTFSGPAKSAAEVEVPVVELRVDDRVVLRPGDYVPVDGVALEGESAVNEAMLTGESAPIDKSAGSKLFAGTMNVNGRLVMRVTATGEGTALAQIIAAVQRAQTSRADIQRLGDRISNVFVPVIVLIAAMAGLWWGLAPESAGKIHDVLANLLWHAHVPLGPATGFIIAAAVLIVACPCAMGLATPAAIMAGANAAARRGILIRDGVALEKAGRITAIVLDKTGTLTRGELTVAGLWTPEESEMAVKNVRILAAAMASPSNHPVSRILSRLGDSRRDLTAWREIPGSGIQAEMTGENNQTEMVRLGSLPWLNAMGVNIPERRPAVEKEETSGATLVGLAQNRVLIAIFALSDFLKPGAAGVVRHLQAQKLKTYLLTGDNAQTAAVIAREAGIPADNVFAGVRPEQKAEFVKKLQAQGERVAFVGDGINDAPALTQADLGIAVSRANDVARAAADIILLKSEIEAVPEAIGLARATLRTIKQNLFWAFFYNALGVPLAALGFISPIFCAAAMGCSDIVVIGNALRLLRWRQR